MSTDGYGYADDRLGLGIGVGFSSGGSAVAGNFFVQEVDGTSLFTLENGTGSLQEEVP